MSFGIYFQLFLINRDGKSFFWTFIASQTLQDTSYLTFSAFFWDIKIKAHFWISTVIRSCLPWFMTWLFKLFDFAVIGTKFLINLLYLFHLSFFKSILEPIELTFLEQFEELCSVQLHFFTKIISVDLLSFIEKRQPQIKANKQLWWNISFFKSFFPQLEVENTRVHLYFELLLDKFLKNTGKYCTCSLQCGLKISCDHELVNQSHKSFK